MRATPDQADAGVAGTPGRAAGVEHRAGDVERRAGAVERRRSFQRFARAGLGARAVIYAVVALLCVDLARRGSAPAPADGSGALEEVARQPAGVLALIVLAVGLLGYAAWRVVAAAAPLGPATRERPARRLGLAASGLVYLGLCVQAIALVAGRDATSGVTSDPEPIAASVLRWPGGEVLLAAVAVLVAVGGVALAVWGAAHDYAAVLRRDAMGEPGFRLARVFGIVGDGVRGALVVVLAGYLMVAAVRDRPGEVKGLDQALAEAAHGPGGVELLALAAAGVFAFSLYSLAEARYRRI
jgi:hypothetical protein